MIITLLKLLEIIDNSMLQVMKTINSENVNQELPYFEGQSSSPLHLAVRSYGHVRVVEYLLQVGADADLQDSRKRTPLDVAAEKDVSYFHFLSNLQAVLLLERKDKT